MRLVYIASIVCIVGVCFAADQKVKTGSFLEKIAESNDDTPPAGMQFKVAYELLVKADDARDGGKLDEAVTLYQKAVGKYITLSRRYPQWEETMTKFRIVYCGNQIDSIFRSKKQNSASRKNPKVGSAEQDKVQKQDSRATVPAPAPPQTITGIEKISNDARAFLSQGKTEQARKVLMQGLDMDPDDESIRVMIGIVQCRTGEFKEALHLLAALIEDDKRNALAHLLLGTAHFGLGRISEAGDSIGRAISLDPNMSEAHYNMVQVIMASAPPDLKAARYHYGKALDLGAERDPALEKLIKE